MKTISMMVTAFALACGAVATIGDVMAVPITNTNLFQLPSQWPARKVFEIPSTGCISTMNCQLGDGFYADVLGHLPFVIGCNAGTICGVRNYGIETLRPAAKARIS